MARIVFDEEFLDAWAMVSSEWASNKIDRVLELIGAMPGMGSSLVPDSVRLVYGPNVLKALAGPYEIVYEYDRENDVVYVYGLLYGPAIQ